MSSKGFNKKHKVRFVGKFNPISPGCYESASSCDEPVATKGVLPQLLSLEHKFVGEIMFQNFCHFNQMMKLILVWYWATWQLSPKQQTIPSRPCCSHLQWILSPSLYFVSSRFELTKPKKNYLQPPLPSPGQSSWSSPPTSALTSPPPAPSTLAKTTKTKIVAVYETPLENMEYVDVPCARAMVRGHALVLVFERGGGEWGSVRVLVHSLWSPCHQPAEYCHRESKVLISK